MRHTISILVENEFGVLSRIAGLFSGRGYNIDSLTVSETLDSTVSRMTIISRGSQRVIDQIIKQLNRLINVISVEDLTSQSFTERELILIKVRRQEETREELLQAVEQFGGRLVDDEHETYMFEFTGDETALSKILDTLNPFGILEFVSSGSIAIEKGIHVLEG